MKTKLLIFCFLLFSATMVRGQFQMVDWNNQCADTLLPVCAQVVELPDDYAEYGYSAHIEYPEFQMMSDADVARFALVEKYGALPEMPVVECSVGIQAKRAQLDVYFLPVVMRDGKYYRINSYKLVLDKHSAPQRQRVAATVAPAERYAASSVLAEGKWVRVAVESNGVHKITDKELKNMGFSNPAKVRLFGYGGHLLPEDDLASLPDDLCEVPLWRENGYVLFYANGTLSWEYGTRSYVHTQNVYSNYGCYFLTEGEVEPMEFPKVAFTPTLSTVYTSYPDYALYEKEKKSLCSYGRVLVDNDAFSQSQGRKKDYKFSIDGVVEGAAVIGLSFATGGEVSSSVSIVCKKGDNTVTAGSLTVGRTSSGEVGKIAQGIYTLSSGITDNPVFSLVHNTNNSSLVGYLDYLSVNYRRSLALRGSSTLFRGDLKGEGYATFEVADCNSDTRVWDVTTPSEIKEVEGVLDGTTYSVVASAGNNSNLVAVDVKGSFPAVKVMGNVPNQNLHALGQVDMVIIVPSNGKFLAAAERLAAAHRSIDGLTVEVVTAQQVYNEFASGTPDVTAYRRLMKMLYDRAVEYEDVPKYLLLFGDGWYDNRLITFPGRKQEDYLLCYESQNSVDAIRSYVLEDYMGYLDDGEGSNHTRDKVDLGVGRIPAQSVADANAVVDKIIAYMQNKNAGGWQNTILLLGDDGDENMPNQHMKDADAVAAVYEREYNSYILNRIYWDDYQIEVSATGKRYPAVTQEIYNALEKGALIVNYSGHGSTNLLSHEMVWKASDMATIKLPRMPFWVTASCDIGPFDMGDNSVAESAIMNADGGAIGLFTTTRTVMQSYNSVINKEFSDVVMRPVNTGEVMAVGDAMRIAKCNVITYGSDRTVNKLQYILLGDPALRLKYPQYSIVVDRVNGVDASETTQVSAGSLLNVEGRVLTRSGELASDFSGVLYSTLFDSAVEVSTRNNTGLGSHTYTAYNKTLFTGTDSVRGGYFAMSMPVPLDISYSNDYGLLSLYAVDTAFVSSAQGRFVNFTVGGTAEDFRNDSVGPEIKLYLNSPSFIDGSEVNSNPALFVELYDENGINTMGTGVGHDITAIVDNDIHHTYNLNSAFVPAVGDYTRGTISMPLKTLDAGWHTLKLRAWDLYNNSSLAEISFYVNPSLAPGLSELKVTPAPVVANSPVTFTLMHNRPESEIEVCIDVFDVQGRLYWSNKERVVCDTNVYTCQWNVAKQGGRPLSAGVYLVRAYVTEGGVPSSVKNGKFVVVNNK
ncbi:MAG: type IX secretion system sortase PorU [Bacteroidaceae bacterium]|nr:type IX secretion system sortase PorU [Bacteroidaceae bacterium]